MFNILTEDLIRYKQDDGKIVWASLPQVYAALVADDIAAFPALRPHQRHASHAFLVQLGVIAMHNAGLNEPPTDADEWLRVIRALTKDKFPGDEPWHLVVDDITKPAFMQPPKSVSANEPNYTKEPSRTPDELDTLDTAKNHSLKKSLIPASELDSWIFALITEQTTDAHLSNNPAISRISGKGSRLAFSITSSTRSGLHFRRDVAALLEQFPSVSEGYSTTIDGHALLWVVPWDGTESEGLTLDKLHPLYIEVCRRRRMGFLSDGSLCVRRVAGTKTRIAKSNLKGRTGDPWIPINLTREKIMTLPKSVGFTYRQIANCLNTGDWELPLLCKPTRDERASDNPMYLVARGIAPGEGQNKTGGYYERIIPIGHKMKMAMMGHTSTQELGDIAKARVDDVGKVKNILRHAIATFAAKGNSDFAAHRNGQPSPNQLARPWTDKLDEIVDANFFNDVQDEFEADESERDGIRKKWLLNGNDGVVDQAERFLKAAEDAIPSLSIQKFKARVRADSTFWGRIRGNEGLPFLFEIEEGE